MKNVLDEAKVKNGTEARTTCCATCCCDEAQELAKRIERGVNDAKAAVSNKLQDSRIAAQRLMKRGQYAVEDSLGETSQKIKRHPVRAVAIGVAAGAALGLLLPRLARK